jgi:SAM-dependent methyltransferase
MKSLPARILDAVSRPFVKKQLIESSRTRWREAGPDVGLTWGKTLEGDNFIQKVATYGGFGPDKSVLEVGPGYGRLLTALLRNHMPFKDYLGVDISEKTVAHLKGAFPVPNVDFARGDIETLALNRKFDLFYSSLTLKHFFPTFEAALRNISSRLLNANAKVIFDLLEGEGLNWEQDKTYVRSYAKDEVRRILTRANLTFRAFDTVEHDPEHIRLLVVAEKT